MSADVLSLPADIYGGDEVLRSCKWLLDEIQRKFERLIEDGQAAKGQVDDEFRQRVAWLIEEFDLVWAEWRTRATCRGVDAWALFEMEASVNALRKLL